MPGIPELLILLAIAVLVFGAGKLPAIGESLGKTIKSFRKATREGDGPALTERHASEAMPTTELPAERRPA